MSFIKELKPQNRKGGPRQGYYHVINKAKYIGDNKIVIYRSSLEQVFCEYCDLDLSVISWVSEPDLQIKYINPFRRRLATYYPDFMVKFRAEDPNKSITAVIEIKAHNMINLPKDGNIDKMSNYVKKQYIVNKTKEQAAEKFCAERNMKYLVITEKSPFFKRK